MSEVWSAGLSTLFEPGQDELVERLRPQEGDRWLDVGGLGGAAMRAARAGADVTAIEADGPPVEQARGAADLWLTADSGEDVWELLSTTAPPVRAARARLYEGDREDDGIRSPRRSLLVLGRRP